MTHSTLFPKIRMLILFKKNLAFSQILLFLTHSKTQASKHDFVMDANHLLTFWFLFELSNFVEICIVKDTNYVQRQTYSLSEEECIERFHRLTAQ